METNLEDSAFLDSIKQMESWNHAGEIFRQSCYVVLTLNQIRLKKWSPENNKIGTKWITHEQTSGIMTTEQTLNELKTSLSHYDEEFKKNN